MLRASSAFVEVGKVIIAAGSMTDIIYTMLLESRWRITQSSLVYTPLTSDAMINCWLDTSSE